MSNLCKFNNWNDCQFVNWSDCYWHSFKDQKDPWGSNQPTRGGDKETKPPIIATDFGRKPYQSKSYSEMMRRTPLRATFDVALQKKSQFEKPYRDDEYPEMQHWQPTPWEWDEGEYNPRVEPTLPPFSPFKMERGWLCSLNCDGEIGRCGNGGCASAIGTCYAEFTTIASAGTWQVTGPYRKLIKGRNNPKFKNHPTSLDSIEIYPDWDKVEVTQYSLWGLYRWKTATFQVTYTDSDGNVCKGELKVSCCTTCECPASLAYSSGNPGTIGQSSEATITVDAGCGPYYWLVTGTGFSFKHARTDTGTNTLISSASACGTATINVNDACGDVTGYVRCTTGQWVLKTAYNDTCVLSGTGTHIDTRVGLGCVSGQSGPGCRINYQYEYISGKGKQEQWSCYQYRSLVSCADANCAAQCNVCGQGTAGCTNCIDSDHTFPCQYDGSNYYRCYAIDTLRYYEWECA